MIHAIVTFLLVVAAGQRAAEKAPPSAADYLAETTWICTMPPGDPYEAHKCGPSPLTKTCTAQWLARCEAAGGALRTCGEHDCDDVYVGKRGRRKAWEAARVRALRKARAELRARNRAANR